MIISNLDQGKVRGTMKNDLCFRPEVFTVREIGSVRFRAFENIVYVERPVDRKYQSLNIYVPEAYYEGSVINGYTMESAPVFFPNTVGGYKPGLAKAPDVNAQGEPDTMCQALQRGYVVVCAGTRGRGLVDEKGEYIGVAPAHIVDLKAAIRYLKWNRERIPGNVDRIISNGTSAGGALSSLLGTTGNHPDYREYLDQLEAAEERDNIFAASCYCPITNLEHADMAYEWEFCGINEGTWWNGSFVLTPEQIALSQKLKENFKEYADVAAVKAFIVKHVILSVQKAVDNGLHSEEYPWIVMESGCVRDICWEEYVRYRTRMKPVPAFDSICMGTPENELFGSAGTQNRHFTAFSQEHSLVNGALAEAKQIKMMNPMNYIQDEAAEKARYFRIRHGAVDRDISLAVSAMLTMELQNAGISVDYFLPWGIPHAGDYDLEELFDWIDGICKENKGE